VRNNSKGFALIVILILVVLGIGGYLIVKNQPSKQVDLTAVPTSTPWFPLLESWEKSPKVLKNIYDQVDTNKMRVYGPYGSLKGWYINKDNLKEAAGYQIEIFISKKDFKTGENDQDPKAVAIIDSIEQEFYKSKWALNKENSSGFTESIDTGGTFYRAYTKDSWKCLVIIPPELTDAYDWGWGFLITVTCFDKWGITL
jgi:hypothetical protein